MSGSLDDLSPAPRAVRPRNRTYKRLLVMAIAGEWWLHESGETDHLSTLEHRLPTLPPTLFVKQSAADFVSRLDTHFAEWDPEHWQWRATVHERDIIRPNGTRAATRVSTAIQYFGFKGGSYHKIIDPVVMYGHLFDTVWPSDEPELTRLLRWGVTLRDFCNKNQLEIRPTIGAISSQFLTDRRFYPKNRRKVPMAINERAREALPVNHYVLTVMPSPRREFTALYLDQRRAHHYHAQHTPMPCSNQLYAYGRFADLAEITFAQPWDDFYGLYCLSLKRPPQYRRSHWITNLDKCFVFSSELPHLYDMGYKVNGVYAAWGSFKRDTGLARYAKWAQKQLDHYGDKPWLKPLLLATYGTLATRPRYGEAIFKLAKGGESVTMITGHNQLEGKRVIAPHKLEPKIANVIHRGMIEAATRSESVGLAQWLTSLDHRVLSIYADAVIVEDDCEKTLPALPEPWRCKKRLSHLQFLSQQAFVSGEMTKLPGVNRSQIHRALARPL